MDRLRMPVNTYKHARTHTHERERVHTRARTQTHTRTGYYIGFVRIKLLYRRKGNSTTETSNSVFVNYSRCLYNGQ